MKATVGPFCQGALPEDDGRGHALAALYEIADLASKQGASRAFADSVLQLLSSRLATQRGMIGYLNPCDGLPPVVTARQMDAGDVHCACDEDWLSAGRPFLLLKGERTRCVAGSMSAGGNPERGEIAFFGFSVPGDLDGGPFVAVDTIFEDGIDPSEDLKLLSAAASFLPPCFRRKDWQESGAGKAGQPATLGRLLQQYVANWIEPMDLSKSLIRSDLYERVISEVEKILLAAALDKADHVQTEAARFLGINRNTLSRKIRKYGLTGEGMERS